MKMPSLLHVDRARLIQVSSHCVTCRRPARHAAPDSTVTAVSSAPSGDIAEAVPVPPVLLKEVSAVPSDSLPSFYSGFGDARHGRKQPRLLVERKMAVFLRDEIGKIRVDHKARRDIGLVAQEPCLPAEAIETV